MITVLLPPASACATASTKALAHETVVDADRMDRLGDRRHQKFPGLGFFF